MEYKLSRAIGEQYYSTSFKPVTEKIEDITKYVAKDRALPPIEAPPPNESPSVEAAPTEAAATAI